MSRSTMLVLFSLLALLVPLKPLVAADATTGAAAADRSPVDLALSPDGAWLLTANQTSGSISLVRCADGAVLAELPCGRRPSAIALLPSGQQALVTATYSGDLVRIAIDGDRLREVGRVKLGFEPRGVAVSPDGKLAYVALTASNEVAVVDLETRQVVARIVVGRWPRYLTLTADGKRLAVGCSGDGGIWVVDTQSGSVAHQSTFQGLNIGHLAASRDGRYAYFPWMVYADRPITPGNIREGWVLGNRIARVRLDEPARREALAIDPRGQAVADPHGMALSHDEQWLALTASGTHELVLFRLADLPLRPDGPGDHMRTELVRDGERFVRIPLGGRPMNLAFDATGKRLYVTNYLSNAVQVVDVAGRRVERTLALGGALQPSLARQGEAIFHDALRSADGWYSCHSCHYEAGTNAVTMDTKNDGSFGTYKMVLSLRNARNTGPWFWHGWQQDFTGAIAKSLADTMQGPTPSDDDARAIVAYLEQLEQPPQQQRGADGSLSAAAERGRQVFSSAAAGCAQCHQGAYLTDGQIHDVGLSSEYDKYQGYNTPSLVDIGNRAGYLHHGRAKDLDELLLNLHSPAKVSGTRELTAEERADLVAYLKSL